jgi:hypothetical protein
LEQERKNIGNVAKYYVIRFYIILKPIFQKNYWGHKTKKDDMDGAESMCGKMRNR